MSAWCGWKLTRLRFENHAQLSQIYFQQ